MSKRFEVYIPGFWKRLWLKMRHPNEWQHRARAVVTDTKGGYCFQVTEEEEVIFDIAMDTSTEIPLSECLSSGRQFKRAREIMSDKLFLAMQENRQGNEQAWSRFISMNRDDWRVWWADLEAQVLVEGRRWQ